MVSRSYIHFGDVRVHSMSHTEWISVTNVGRETERVNVGGYCGDFSTTSSCFQLEPGQSCTITTYMRPMSTGMKFCTVMVNGSTSSRSISLNGNAVDDRRP